MQLYDLTRDLPVEVDPAVSLEINGLTADSRSARSGFLFAALKGESSDGVHYARAAVSAGASAILAGVGEAINDVGVPVIHAKDPRRILALMAARFFPRQPDHLIAITGTSGKTSVSVFVRQILEKAGHPAASIGTIGVVGPGGFEPGSLTTPDPVALHGLLDRLVQTGGVTHAVLEASSHGLDQRRLDGLRLVAAGFTNLGRDHLDYHQDNSRYLAAKLRLFRELLPPTATAVINADSDVCVEVIAAAGAAAVPMMMVGRAGTDLRILDAQEQGEVQQLTLGFGQNTLDVTIPFAGAFQADNAVMAAALAIAVGIDPEFAIRSLAELEGAPGRLEKVGQTRLGATIFVDYAHKPEALAAALAALRPLASGRLLVVFGAGGDRDSGKRRLMGEAAAKGADIVIVTDDNPRNEDPAAIRATIIGGAPNAIEIPGRGQAIQDAVEMLVEGDVLCIAGKGHETGQTIAGATRPFSDHKVVAKALVGR